MTSAGPLEHIHEHPEISAADVALIARHARADARVLDIGAGRGGFVALACQRGYRAIALDLETSAAPLWKHDGIPGVLGDGSRLPFTDAHFDVVRMKELIEHLVDPLIFVREAKRVLKPGGILIAHVPSPYSQFFPVGNFRDDYTHVRPFSKLGLRRLTEDSGLMVLQISGYVAGRNAVERVIGGVLSRVLPHTYRLVARKPS